MGDHQLATSERLWAAADLGAISTLWVSGGLALAPEAGAAGAATRAAGAEGVAAETTSDHIVLGLENQGLEQTANQVGGRTLMNDTNWQTTLQNSLGNSNTRFTVSLDGVSGSSTYSQFMSSAQRGLTPGASPFNWEMGQMFQAGRHVDANFVRDLGQTLLENPFGH